MKHFRTSLSIYTYIAAVKLLYKHKFHFDASLVQNNVPTLKSI